MRYLVRYFRVLEWEDQPLCVALQWVLCGRNRLKNARLSGIEISVFWGWCWDYFHKGRGHSSVCWECKIWRIGWECLYVREFLADKYLMMFSLGVIAVINYVQWLFCSDWFILNRNKMETNYYFLQTHICRHCIKHIKFMNCFDLFIYLRRYATETKLWPT